MHKQWVQQERIAGCVFLYGKNTFLAVVCLLAFAAASPVVQAQPAVTNQALSNQSIANQNPQLTQQQTAQAAPENGNPGVPEMLDVEQMTSPQGLNSTLKLFLLLTVLSLAPSILIMTTSFIRFVIVFGLLRQALGTQQLPPNQVLTSLSLFLTVMVMAPIWQKAYEEGIVPYTHQTEQAPVTLEAAFQKTVSPLRKFMSDQIELTGNSDTVWMFLDYQQPLPGSPGAADYKAPSDYDEVPLTVLLPAYMLSEVKTAFLIGFQLYLPFIVIDMVISSILISMGMMMLPPVLISLPFKILLFVLIDGWLLTVGMLLESIRAVG
ncbi:flagellar type III secretion system pore protein FliP [Gimesia fumaroli]|uniref:Flagellar biosynthetic protein FliP n=1 Tax=Gimesia fumaroli TaxID=2527976 RepID=A0A518IAR6_9PLAN|nr:flagellar type III secretion system pore protein FliP [Gimesia fumaroli]QDV50211.1 Flagellar biosynthetic protein FliP precursor [Gimesia fumaroli]